MAKPIPKTRIHPETGKVLNRGERRMTVEYRGLKRVVKVNGWFPDDDSDGLMWRDDGAAADQALAELKAEHAARMRELTRYVLKTIQEKSKKKLSNTALSILLTGSPNSFSKYELGNATPSHPTFVLLSLLKKRPELMKEIEAISEQTAA